MFKPIFANNICDYEKLIKPDDGFIKRIDIDRGYIAYDTGLFSSSKFPEITSEMSIDEVNNNLLKRDLRGIKFSLSSGNIICRPFNKFFNVGEREETQPKNIDLSLSHYLYNKLDGSMISSMIPDDGKLYYTTKKGVTKISNQIHTFVKSKNALYDEFSRKSIEDGYTPIFEWCSRKQKIVLDYPIDRLVLIAMRHLTNGNYLLIDDIANYADPFGVEYLVPELIDIKNINELIQYTKSLVGLEGYVIMMPDGDRFKIKADDYCRIHKTLEGIVYEKDILEIICNNKLDDLIPNLPEDVANITKKFEASIIDNITEKAKLFSNDVIDIRKTVHTKKDFAFAIKDKANDLKSIYFKLYDKLNDDPNTDIIDFTINIISNNISKKCSSQSKVDEVRWLFNVRWEDYYYNSSS